jgi:hypothetical protein
VAFYPGWFGQLNYLGHVEHFFELWQVIFKRHNIKLAVHQLRDSFGCNAMLLVALAIIAKKCIALYHMVLLECSSKLGRNAVHVGRLVP